MKYVDQNTRYFYAFIYAFINLNLFLLYLSAFIFKNNHSLAQWLSIVFFMCWVPIPSSNTFISTLALYNVEIVIDVFQCSINVRWQIIFFWGIATQETNTYSNKKTVLEIAALQCALLILSILKPSLFNQENIP